MKKVFLLLLPIVISTMLHAQEQLSMPYIDYSTVGVDAVNTHALGAAEKKTSGADTAVYVNSNTQISSSTTYRYYVDVLSPLDSGYYLGINVFGYKGWAEAYNLTVPNDSAMQVIGAISVWHGNYKLTTNKSVNIEVWDVDTVHGTSLHSGALLAGFPNTVLTSETVPIKKLKMGYNNAPDTLSAITWFSTPANVTGYFFLGYEMMYDFHNLNGDTICIRATQQGTGVGHNNFYYIDKVGDTVFHARNAVELASGTWLDPYWQAHLDVNLSIVPIVHIRDVTAVSNISRNGLSFYGVYPNPAVNNAIVRFALNNPDNVCIQLMDIQGHIILTKKQSVSAGMHAIAIDIAGVNNGNYLCVVNAGNSTGFASMLTVTK
ncbi:MAG: T9SS type A sorting domain-containing protein [Flavipsychrobacter sp.]